MAGVTEELSSSFYFIFILNSHMRCVAIVLDSSGLECLQRSPPEVKEAGRRRGGNELGLSFSSFHFYTSNLYIYSPGKNHFREGQHLLPCSYYRLRLFQNHVSFLNMHSCSK